MLCFVHAMLHIYMDAEPVLETVNETHIKLPNNNELHAKRLINLKTPYSTPSSDPCSFKLSKSIEFEIGLDTLQYEPVMCPKHIYPTDIDQCSLKNLPNSIDIESILGDEAALF